MTARIPLVSKGAPILARDWNAVVKVVNGAIAAPRDVTSDGALRAENTADFEADLIFKAFARTGESVRITNAQDENQFVDVDRALSYSGSISDGRTFRLEIDV